MSLKSKFLPQDQVVENSIEGTKSIKVRNACYRVWTLVGIVILAIVLGTILQTLAIPVAIIIWSVIIVFCLRGPVNKLEARGVNRGVGTALAYLGMVVVLAVFGLLLFSPVFGIGEQFTALLQSIPGYIQQLTDLYNQLQGQYSFLWQNETIKSWVDEASGALTAWASSAAKISADGIVAFGSALVNSFISIGFALVVAFWLLMELPALGRETKRLISPKYQEDARMLHLTFTRVMGGYIKATLLQCFLIGLACGISYAIMGLPYAAALGGITGILNIIPVVGPWLGGGLAALIGVFVSPWIALIAVVVTIAIQQFVYTFVSPKIMANSVDIHPALVILALVTGSAIGGAMGGLMGTLVGMLASIPAVAAIKAVFVYYFEKGTGRQIVSTDGVFFKGKPGAITEALAENPLADVEAICDAEPLEETEKKERE